MSEHKNSVYRRISLDIKEKIQNGHYPVGTKLPPERQLMSEYQVERLTVRRALDVLANEKLITKKSGLGSFVADPNAAASATHHSESPQQVSEPVQSASALIQLLSSRILPQLPPGSMSLSHHSDTNALPLSAAMPPFLPLLPVHLPQKAPSAQRIFISLTQKYKPELFSKSIGTPAAMDIRVRL